MGVSPSKDRKGICLIKYDNFESKWKYVAGDFANSNEEFSTFNVKNVLKQQSQ